jgi:bifunctional DNase/RNase
MPEPEKLVEMELGRLVLRDHSLSAPQYVFLREKDGERSFPIVIGFPEAAEIQRVVTGVETERPMTHQLLAQALRSLGARLVRVEITDLRHNTFYAQLVLEDEDGHPLAVLDARPSDSLALASRVGCPVLVSEHVLETARTDEAPDDLEDEPED